MNITRCPHCDCVLGEGDKVYRIGTEVIGCDLCVEEDYIEEDEYDEEEGYADYCDMLNDLAREERMFGI